MPYFTPINGVIKKVYSSRIYDNTLWNFTGLNKFSTIDVEMFKSYLMAKNDSLYSIATSNFELKEGDIIELYVYGLIIVNSEEGPSSSISVDLCVGNCDYGTNTFDCEKKLLSNNFTLGGPTTSSTKTVNTTITNSDLNVNDRSIKMCVYIENPADSGKSISRINSITLKVNGNEILTF